MQAENARGARTLYDKLWDEHVVAVEPDGTAVLYVDRHLINEVTSAQAFQGLEDAGRPLWRRSSVLAVADHNVPTHGRERGIEDPIARIQVEALDHHCRRHVLPHLGMADRRQGIVHVVAPELGLTLPDMTVVCGDSHTSTHGALAALAFGIGTSDVEHVLATQTVLMRKSASMRVTVGGPWPAGCYAKDLALAIIRKIGASGAAGHALEFSGAGIQALSLEARMTLCNMAIEAGARSGLVAVDDATLDYLAARPLSPTGSLWEQAAAYWRTLHSDAGARFDREVTLDLATLRPHVTWGNSPDMALTLDERVPDPDGEALPPSARAAMVRALEYMGLTGGQPIRGLALDKVFIGSCTNSRIEDLRTAADVVARSGRRVHRRIRQALVVPGSGLVKAQAETEGLDRIFLEAGFEWRDPGCSMCLAMNADRLAPGERCASTSNRNFEGRQGAGGRSHLLSPALAASSALCGAIDDAFL